MLSAVLVVGCGRTTEVVEPKFGDAAPEAYTPVADSSNAYDYYLRAAQMAADIDDSRRFEGPKHYRDDFPPSARRKLMAALAPAVALLQAGAKHDCRIEFRPAPFMGTRRDYQGWRLLGKVLAWRMEARMESNPAGAVTDMLTATKVALDLTGGGVTDAAAGWALLDDVRAPFVRKLGKVPSDQLNRLADGIQERLAAMPRTSATLAYEREVYGTALQGLWVASRDRKLDAVEKALGANGREALKPVRERQADGIKERMAFFQALERRAQYELRMVGERAELPTVKRTPYAVAEGQPKPVDEPEIPAKTLTMMLFRTGRYYLEIRDRGLARLRMLGLSAKVQAAFRKSSVVPKALPSDVPDLTTDPFTGKPFIYLSDSDTFKIYSPGADGRDDGGKTDESFTTPDLMLEAQTVR
jgi:hypothetical protein